QYADFNVGATAVLNTAPTHASAFVLNGDGSFSYTPKTGYSNRTDSFTYHLVSANGASSTGKVQIHVAAPAAPSVDTPTFASVAGTSATLGGDISSNG